MEPVKNPFEKKVWESVLAPELKSCIVRYLNNAELLIFQKCSRECYAIAQEQHEAWYKYAVNTWNSYGNDVCMLEIEKMKNKEGLEIIKTSTKYNDKIKWKEVAKELKSYQGILEGSHELIMKCVSYKNFPCKNDIFLLC